MTTTTTTSTTTVPPTTSTTAPKTTTTVSKAAAHKFCMAAAGVAQSLIKDGQAVESYKGGKPSKAIVHDVAALAADFKKLVPSAPGDIHHDMSVAATQYGNLARAMATGSVAKIETAFTGFERSGVISDLLKVETFEEHNCT